MAVMPVRVLGATSSRMPKPTFVRLAVVPPSVPFSVTLLLLVSSEAAAVPRLSQPEAMLEMSSVLPVAHWSVAVPVKVMPLALSREPVEKLRMPLAEAYGPGEGVARTRRGWRSLPVPFLVRPRIAPGPPLVRTPVNDEAPLFSPRVSIEVPTTVLVTVPLPESPLKPSLRPFRSRVPFRTTLAAEKIWSPPVPEIWTVVPGEVVNEVPMAHTVPRGRSPCSRHQRAAGEA